MIPGRHLQPAEPPPPEEGDMQDEYRRMAGKVRSGEYFEESRRMFDLMVHDPMAERYLYILITVVAAFVFMVAYSARDGLFPLNYGVPYVFYPEDMTEDLPHIEPLAAYKGEAPVEGVLRYVVGHYVKLREEYNVDDFDRLALGVRNQSAPEVIAEYNAQVNPANPDSPITLYERHSTRKVDILSTRRLSDQEYGMEVIYEATVIGQGEVRKSRWKAMVAFQYDGATLDDETGKLKPLSFVVTKYQTKRIQDAQ